MNARLALLLTLLLSTISIAPSFAAGDRYALVIGNAKYPDADTPLKDPINDTQDVANELKREGFDVDVGYNLTGAAMRRAFDWLYNNIKPGSVALIFFSGFGVQAARQTYMIPVDAKIWTAGLRSGQGWRDYDPPARAGDRAILEHRDHVHVDVYA